MKKKEETIFQLLSQKPWESSQAKLDNDHDGKTLNLSREKIGVRTVIVVSTIIFSFFIVAYADRLLIHDWKSMPEPWLLWVNTSVLMITSYFFHKTKIASDRSENEKVKNGLFIVGFLSFVFIIGQLLAWYQLLNLGYFASSNIANAFFYLLTTLHGLHMLGGLIFWGLTTSKFLKGNYRISRMQRTIELCAIYWHFLLIVWFVLFGLMLFT
jgi:cytochrome c oxidase subunit 3